MDQLNKYLVVLKKYQFWAICLIVSLTAMICYLAASGGLARQTSERAKKLASQFNAVKVEANYPNQGVIEAIEKKHDALKRSVDEAWEMLYHEQEKNNPLPSVLNADFKAHFESLKPKEQLAFVYRAQYQNFIRNELPSLLTLVDARRPAAAGGQPAGGGAAKGTDNGPRGGLGQPGAALMVGRPMAGRPDANADDGWIGIVDWTPADFAAIESGFDWRATPSTLEVVLAQEDLWVIQALLRVIRNTNDGATSNATAAVKRIDALQIGKVAAAAWKQGVAAVSSEAGGGFGKGEGGVGKGGDESVSSSGGDAAASADERVRQSLISRRYIDDKGDPVPYSEESPYYAAHPYNEFVMMPIHMSLLMDQRRVPKLLVECANSSMPIEVRQVRMTKTPGSVLDFSGGGGGGRDRGGGGRDGRGGMAPGRALGGALAMPDGEKTDVSPYDVPVDILGVIYIYNPPVTRTASTETAAGPAEPSGETP